MLVHKPCLAVCLLLIKLCFVQGQYNLYEVLQKSILFYEAQRSGALPGNNRIPWRGDSCLNDRGNRGEDLTGGWYDAGDTMKFGFPMAFATTTLAWGILEFGNAYRAAGEYENALNSIRWPLDYFIKCHPQTNVFYGQVGDANADHAWWGRPEDNTMYRPAFELSDRAPGSDLLGETAAAMAASSIVFRDSDNNYANTLLGHARQIYALAYAYRGLYHDSIPNAATYYRSSGYNDELGWAAAWLYRATGESNYLNQALEFANPGATGYAFNWDDKTVGAQLLLAVHGQQGQFADAVRRFIGNYLPGGSVRYTPKGLACVTDWGSLAAAAGAAFISLVGANYGYYPNEGRNFARSQINYILGDAGHSFVVGFGYNPPLRPHHRASSCPNRPAPCDWNTYNSPDPNPQTLTGAVVSGPDCDDYWIDDRASYQRNEAATDYNAAFQGAVAGLLALGH